MAGRSAAWAEDGGRPFLAYLTSWTEVRTDSPTATRLARLPGYITHVALGFARPDMTYAGNLDLAGTGLQFPFSGQVLKAAIAELRRHQPSVRVLVSVGGWGHFGWDARNFDALARLVKDLGADGVDLDYETADSGCVRTPEARIACADDARSIAVLEDLRRALPRPFVLTVAGWSVGAYGEGRFAASEPRYGPYVGMMLALLRSPAAAGIDLVSVMAYDAGPKFSPGEAFHAYRNYWRGPLALGIQVLPPQSGGPRDTVERTARMLSEVLRDPKGGAMLYGIGLKPPGATGPDNPDDVTLALTICVALGLEGCVAPVP
ncbi:glycoside hydrolase family 18 protein [Xanthobacter autotrophicus DSM 431]|uniref:glycoside hydrolase family 18 protein n=1 Tax=Xanthobacter nonsaccharivorans TaxID=3119912 RepID=UPI00372BFAE3